MLLFCSLVLNVFYCLTAGYKSQPVALTTRNAIYYGNLIKIEMYRYTNVSCLLTAKSMHTACIQHAYICPTFGGISIHLITAVKANTDFLCAN